LSDRIRKNPSCKPYTLKVYHLVTTMERSKLNEAEIHGALEGLTGWRLGKDKLIKEFKFDDFFGAFSAMTKGAMLSEKLNHHPEWTNVYSSLKIELSTHDAGGVTPLDIKWAQEFDRLVKQR